MVASADATMAAASMPSEPLGATPSARQLVWQEVETDASAHFVKAIRAAALRAPILTPLAALSELARVQSPHLP